MSENGLTGAAARREQSRKEMRAAILAEARRIVSDEGIERLSMRAIARALGYSPGALYEYFQDKDAILNGLYFEGAGGLGDRLASTRAAMAPDTNAVVTLAALGRAYRAFALEHADLYQLTFKALPDPTNVPVHERSDKHQGGFAVLAQVIGEGIATGMLVDLPVMTMAITCWSAVHGYVSLELSGHLAGGCQPGQPPDTLEEGRANRDADFEHLLHSLFLGFVREDKRAMLPISLEPGSNQSDPLTG